MVLTNAERQRRYKERLKAAAASSVTLSDAMAELVARNRGLIEDLDQQISLLESGAVRYLRGNADATPEAIFRAKATRARLQELVDKYDPEGSTALAPREGGTS